MPKKKVDGSEPRCCATVRRRGRGAWPTSAQQCERRGTLEHEGKMYCGTHHPDSIRKREEKSRAHWDKQRRHMQLQMRQGSAKERVLKAAVALYRSAEPITGELKRAVEELIDVTEDLRALEEEL